MKKLSFSKTTQVVPWVAIWTQRKNHPNSVFTILLSNFMFFFFSWQSYIEKGSYRWPLNLNEAYTWGPFKDSRHWGLLVEMFFMQVLLRMKLGILCSFSHMNQIKNVHQQNYKNMRNHNPQNLLHGYYSTVIKQQSYFIFSAYNSIPSFLSKVTIFLRPYSCPLRGIFHFDRNFTSFFI